MDWKVFGFILVRIIRWCFRGKHLTPAVVGVRGHFIMSLFLLRIADRVTCRVRGKFLVGVGGGGEGERMREHGHIPSTFLLNLYTLTSVCVFSILFSIHLLGADKVIISFILMTLMYDSGVMC